MSIPIYDYNEAQNEFVLLTGQAEEKARNAIKMLGDTQYALDLWTYVFLPGELPVTKECYFAYMRLARSIVLEVAKKKKTRLIGYLECGYIPLFMPPSTHYGYFLRAFEDKLRTWCEEHNIPIKTFMPMSFSEEEARFEGNATTYWIHKLDYASSMHIGKSPSLITVEDVWNSVEGL